MDDYRLKMKIGEHEFEAEGPVEIVQGQLAVFKELIANLPAKKNEPPQAGEQSSPNEASSGSLLFEKISRLQGRTVSLTVPAGSTNEAILVLLLGQRHFRNNDSVTGGEIMDGLRESGRTVSRVDHILDRLASEGSVIRIGTGRARRYRLTNPGITRAQEIARGMVSLVP